MEVDPGGRLEFDQSIKLELYRYAALEGRPPAAPELAMKLGLPAPRVTEAYGRLAAKRLLVLEDDGESVRMAPPFSGVPTQHEVDVDGVHYYANCAWDSLGIPAALHRPGFVSSRCGATDEPLRLAVSLDGPPPSDWLFHCSVPAARWWADIVFT